MCLFYPGGTQVDVDAALVEAERVGQACSRQFPTCSVSRIDILRFEFVKCPIILVDTLDWLLLQGLQGPKGHFLQHAYAIWVVDRADF